MTTQLPLVLVLVTQPPLSWLSSSFKCTLQYVFCYYLYRNVLMTNEMHDSYNQFLFHSFLSALHVSNESTRSSSGARHNILYYAVQLVQSVQSCYQASPAAFKALQFFLHPHNNRTYRDIPNCNIQHKNAPED